jgi:hypothetical protein
MKSNIPHFHSEVADERFLWVCDQGQRVALLDRHELNFELIHAAPTEEITEYSLPRYYHSPTLRGARLTAFWWLDSLFAPSSQHRTLTIDEDSTRWSFRMEEAYDASDQGEGFHEYSLVLQEGRYVVECRAHLSLNRACRSEFANFLAYGVGESWPRRKQFTHTVWSHPDGRVLCLPHNPLHPILPGAGMKSDQRRVGKFIGFFAKDKPAWVVEFTESSPGLRSGTCDNAYDEHLQFLPEAVDDDGLHTCEVRYQLKQLEVQSANEILAAAQFIDPFPGDLKRNLQWRVPAFTPGIGSKDDKSISPEVTYGEPFIGVCWPTQDGAWKQTGVFADAQISCSSSTSLRLENSDSEETKVVVPNGTSIHLDSSKRYRFQACVKTEGESETVAYLAARQIIYSLAQVEQHDESERLEGTQDWTTLDVEIVPVEHDPYVVISLHLDGAGKAWFDCISLTEIEAPAIEGATRISE